MLQEVARELDGAGRRERKKRATRLALKAAALDLVAARGFARVTVDDICDVVDVSARTFFNYFPTKEAAVVGEDPGLIEAMRDELLALPAALSPLEALRTVLLARLRAIEEDIDISGEGADVWIRRFALVRSQPEVLIAYTKHLALVEQAIIDALVERLGGDERDRKYAAIVTTAALGAMRVSGMYLGAEGAAESFIESASAAFDLLAAGLSFEAHAARYPALASGDRPRQS